MFLEKKKMQDGVLEKFLDVRCAPTVNANVRCKPGTGGVGGVTVSSCVTSGAALVGGA